MTPKINNNLYIITGAPASGKTTFGYKLASEIKACFLDSDQVTERLIQVSLTAMNKDPGDRDSEFYKQTFREMVYETLLSLTEINIPNVPVVVAAPFTKEIQNVNWKKELELRFKAEISIYYLSCNAEERLRRITERNEQRDLAKLANWEESRAYYGYEKKPNFDFILIET